MTELERELDIQLADALEEVERLKKQAVEDQKKWEQKYMLLRTDIAVLMHRLRKEQA